MPKKYLNIFDQLLKNSKWNGECLESTYRPNPAGCPYFTNKNKLIRVSRACWEYHHGPIPLGLFVCHHCDNPKCFRIEHLFLGTPSDNMQDMIKKGRDNIFGARKYPKDLYGHAEKLWKEGKTYQEMGQILNMNCGALGAYFSRRGMKKGYVKADPWKMTPELINEIKIMKNKGLSDVDIYKTLGISESSLYRLYRMQKRMKGIA